MNRWFRTWRSLTLSALLMVLALTALQPSFTAFGADCGANNICYAELYHDSRDLLYRTPNGPAPINTAVTIRFRTASDDVAGVDLRVYNTKLGVNNFNAMTKVFSDGTYDYWERTVNTGATANILYYWFRINDGSATAYYEDDSAGGDFQHKLWGGSGVAVSSSNDFSWALTVYDPAFTTPDWVKDGIFYQIFPDRFRNGDSANDNGAGEFFYDEAGGTIVRSNSTDWNTAICDPREVATACSGSYSRNFYGGDLKGIQDELAYIKSLGVTVIYMTPVFESPSNHKYDASDYSVVDDNFGGDAALTALVTAAHAEGMHVVLDGVFNHVSSDSGYFDRYNRYTAVGACESTASPFIDMFKPMPLTGTPPAPCSDGRFYASWFGFDSLPELSSQVPGSMARDAIWDGGILHPSGKNAEIGTYWITDFEIDGWRLDVANDVDPSGSFGSNDYWENFRDKVKAADPEAYIVGEYWGIGTQWMSGGVSDGYTPTGANPGEWDANMNYQQTAMLFGFWRDTALNAENDFNGGSLPGKIVPFSPSMFVARYNDLKERYAPESFYALMNLNGSHDTQRALWLLDETIPASPSNGTAYPSATNHYEDGQPGEEAIDNLMGYSLMQFSLPGAPQIYYGTEVGLVNPSYFHGGKWEDDPYNRAPFPWSNETGTPYFTHMTDGNTVRTGLLDFFSDLGAARNAHPALRTGEVEFSLVDDGAKQLGFYRYMPDGSDAAVVLINRGASAASMTIDLGRDIAVGETFTDAISGATYTTVAGASSGQLTVPSVAADSGVLLVMTSGAYSIPPVSTLSLGGVSGTSITVNWTDGGLHSYEVFRSSFPGGGARQLLGSTAVDVTTYTDTTALTGVTYYYTVEAIDADGVSSGSSNEVEATAQYDLTTSYRNVQWPPTLTQVLSAVDRTDDVYGKIYLAGVTDSQSTPVEGITAQLGYGNLGTNPSSHISWTWENATPNVPAATGNDDEFIASLLPTAIGTFSYTYRYSSDGGSTWFYAFDFPNAPFCDEATQSGYVLCTLTVNASSDVTAPSAVVLTKAYDYASRVGLSWTASTDDVAVQGYRIYRSDDGGTTYDLIATLGAATLIYEDTSVAISTLYQYYVTAFDSSFNESADSNIVNAETVASPVNVTFQVTVPAFTKTSSAVQMIGEPSVLTGFGGSGVNMTQMSPTLWQVTLSLNEGDVLTYKFRRDASWDKVEKDPNGYDEILGGGNRGYTVPAADSGPYTVPLTVVNWRDVLLVSTSIANGATDVPIASTFTATFNKTISSASTFSMVDSGANAVSGTFARSGDELSLTFTPSASLSFSETYTVTIAAIAAAGDGGRFFTDIVMFSTPAGYDLTGSYRNVQSPTSMTHVVSAVDRTDTVYGQIYVGGLTDTQSTPVDGLTAQLGFGDLGTNPSSDASWTWEDAVPNAGFAVNNNDEFEASLLPPVAGTFSYTYRYSGNGGTTWFYAYDSNGNVCDEVSQAGYALCTLTVTASGDVTSPTAVTLTLDYDFASRVGLSWTASTDNVALQGYRIYRSSNAGVSYTPLTTVSAATTSYEDGSVAANTSYKYYVVAFDSSLNDSTNSNIVDADTTAATVNVTFQVTVPAFTKTSSAVQVIGNRGAYGEAFDPLTEWGAGANLTQVSATLWEGTLAFNEGDVLEFKFRRDGSWDKAEKAANGYDDIANRFYTVPSAAGGPVILPLTVANWRDVLLVSVTPTNGATDVAVASNITATFNKTISGASTFVVEDSANAVVAGAFSLSGDELSLTFNPTADLAYNETFDVTIAAGVDAAGDGDRYFSDLSSFTTVQLLVPVTFNVSVPSYTPAGATLYIAGNTAQLGSNDPDFLALTGGTVTVNLGDGATITYFYSRGSTATRETGADNATFATHTITVSNGLVVNDTVLNWEDPLVASSVPEDGDILVPVDDPISVTFTKNLNFSQSFTVKDASNVTVAGAFVYNPGSFTYTFTPAADLAYDSVYTVTVTGFVATDGAVQQVSHSFSFTTEPAPIQVTWTVTVPTFTPTGSSIFLVYDFSAAGGTVTGSGTEAMTPTGVPYQYTVSLPLLETADVTYTYNRGTTNTEATLADGETADDHSFTVTDEGSLADSVADTVVNWRDPIVVSHVPASDATQQSVMSDIVITFSKPISVGTFTVTDSDSAVVPGSISLTGGSNVITFMPAAPGFRHADTISVTIAGFPGFVTGTQVSSVSFSFETEALELLTNTGFEADPVTFKPDPWKIVKGTSEKVKCNDPVPRFAIAHQGLCAFMFRSSATEDSRLNQNLITSLSAVSFEVGDELLLSGWFSTSAGANMRMQLRIYFADNTFVSKNVVITGQAAYHKVSVPTITLTRTDIIKIRVQVRNLTKGSYKRAWVDDVSLKLRQGDVVVRGGSTLTLPLPGNFRGGN